MSIPVFDSGALRVTVRFSWQKRPNGPWYYRRVYPKDIAQYFERIGQPVPKCHVVSLKTYDLKEAAKLIIRLARQDDVEWERIRRGLSPKSGYRAAESLLLDFGIDTQNLEAYRRGYADTLDEVTGCAVVSGLMDTREANADAFLDYLRSKVSGDDAPASYLKEHEMTALHLLNGTYEYRLSDALRHYLEKRDAAGDKKKVNDTNRAFALVMEPLGDKPLDKYRRREVQEAIRKALADGLKTASIRKRLGTVRAAVNDLIRDYELADIRNAFERFEIPKLGEDAAERDSLTPHQLLTLREYVRSTAGATSNMIGLLMDTGARLSEIGGLWVQDVSLDTPIPHVLIHENPMRRLKTKASRRTIPLVGEALLSAQRAVAEAAGGKYLFPRYMSDEGFRNDNASAALRKVMGRLDCQTPHWLRHTMRTRLRDADVPEPRAKEIQGWSRDSVADQYGKQTALKNLRADLLKTL